MFKRVEVAILAVSVLACAALLTAIARLHGAGSEAMAAWVQAIGTIAAILLVTFPVIVEHRMQRRRSRQLVLAAAEMAYGTMSAVADRNINPNYVGSEWWVPQWDILDKALADCPIHETGSAEALEAFVFFRECFARAKGFDDAGPSAGGFVISVTMNAGSALEDLRRALGPEAETSVTRARKSRRQSDESRDLGTKARTENDST